MKRIITSCVILGVLFSAPLASFANEKEKKPLSTITKIEAYMNGIKTFRGKFTQRTPDGNTTKGMMHLKRPHHLKFSYDEPKGHFLLANEKWLMAYDPVLEEGSYIEVKSTPAILLLKKNLSFKKDSNLKQIAETDEEIILFLSDKEDAYKIVIHFSKDPLALKGWEVFDPQGQKTVTELSNVEHNVPINKAVFHYKEKKHLN